MSLRVNFSDVKDQSFEAKPKGWYTVKITDCEVRTTKPTAKNPNQEYLNLELTIVEGDYAGKKFWVSLFPTIESAFGILRGFLRATGRWSEEELEGDSDGNVDLGEDFEEFYDRLDGAVLKVYNRPEEYDDQMRDRIRPNFKSVEGEKVDTGKVNPGNTLLP